MSNPFSNPDHAASGDNRPSFGIEQTEHEAAVRCFSETSVGNLLDLASTLNPIDRAYVEKSIIDVCSTDREASQFKFGSNYMASLLDMEQSVGALFRTVFEARRGKHVIEENPLPISIDYRSRTAYTAVDVDGERIDSFIPVGFTARRASYQETQDPNVLTIDGEVISERVRVTAIQAIFECSPDEAQAIRGLVGTAYGYENTIRTIRAYAQLPTGGLDISRIEEYVKIVKDHNAKLQEADAERLRSLGGALLEIGIDYEVDVAPVVKGLQDGSLQILNAVNYTTYKPLDEIISDAQAADPAATALRGVAVSGGGHVLGINKDYATIYTSNSASPELDRQ
jgi:hypothetical protein